MSKIWVAAKTDWQLQVTSNRSLKFLKLCEAASDALSCEQIISSAKSEERGEERGEVLGVRLWRYEPLIYTGHLQQ